MEMQDKAKLLLIAQAAYSVLGYMLTTPLKVEQMQ
jgi:hypothetical protein